MPVLLSRLASEHVEAAWRVEALKPIRCRKLFKFGEIADSLARKLGRQEVDKAESDRIGFDLVEWFERGEFAYDGVLEHVEAPPHFRPFKPILEDLLRQAERDGGRVALPGWRELILARDALKTYLDRSSLDGGPRLIREWFLDAKGRQGERPTSAQLDEWMKENAVPGNKRDVTVADCCFAMNATVRDAKAAWGRLPADKRLRPGQKTLRPKIDH